MKQFRARTRLRWYGKMCLMPNPLQQDRVTAELRRDIAAGTFEPGSFLPSSRKLATRFGVVRNTVAAGIAPLVEEGLVQSLPKRGYQVIGAPASAFEVTWTQEGLLLPVGQERLDCGEQLRVETLRAPQVVADLLRGPEEMEVLVRSTVHHRAGAPWALREFYVPQSVAETVRRLSAPAHVDEVRLLSEHDLDETDLRSRWSTRAAAGDEARLLKSGPSPVHDIQRTGFHDGAPVFCELLTVSTGRVFLSQSRGSVPDASIS
ncbi:GntR family transcriptional regulator [Streptomyces sp. OfavH-34-F]|uniref:GntR family transcriptional regulator n=1 Tax=Streptomyces sp. OfavH-34-F TaxID=2917760 RepID=UPI001EF21716|nr:GntR family transcriptional regulator [Streptomyces sp. OfavH-34-F]MCG7524040.1 GntR family transcriptional regulator [Streptomyces sp. OfavH-34-F]